MPAATNQQMQVFADQRLRPFAEHLRALLVEARDHRGAIDDVYARAVSASRWTDARTDGPPHLLMSGNSASPDDMLVFNTFLAAFIAFMDGNAEWQVLQDACVQPIDV